MESANVPTPDQNAAEASSEARLSCFVSSSATFVPLLRILGTIPPERVGLHGEYDHSGLAKRVSYALFEQFEPAEIAHLRISQRGTVVVIVGKVANPHVMARLISIILGLKGAADVEINGMSMIRPLCVSAIEPDYALSEAVGHFAC